MLKTIYLLLKLSILRLKNNLIIRQKFTNLRKNPNIQVRPERSIFGPERSDLEPNVPIGKNTASFMLFKLYFRIESSYFMFTLKSS